MELLVVASGVVYRYGCHKLEDVSTRLTQMNIFLNYNHSLKLHYQNKTAGLIRFLRYRIARYNRIKHQLTLKKKYKCHFKFFFFVILVYGFS